MSFYYLSISKCLLVAKTLMSLIKLIIANNIIYIVINGNVHIIIRYLLLLFLFIIFDLISKIIHFDIGSNLATYHRNVCDLYFS